MDLCARPTGGDRRSIGCANEVVRDVLTDPARVADVVDGLFTTDPLIRMRCADVLEKVSVQRPDVVQSHRERLLQLLATADQQEVRWHLAQMVPRLALTDHERATAVNHLWTYLDDRSRIVQTFALQALAELAIHDLQLRPKVVALLEERTQTGSPAVRARGRRLLAEFRI
jgi:hypothetical protein